MMLLTVVPAILLAATSTTPRGKRSYAERTAARRRRTNQLLESIGPPPTGSCATIDEAMQNIAFLEAPSIDWAISDEFDPQQSGSLQQDTPRSQRKRVQVEAFLHLCRQLLPDQHSTTIVDAGSGAGNLAIPLSGILKRPVLAIDINPVALKRLEERAACATLQVSTLCADLASAVLPDAGIVCSLHACGAATDMAMRLATQHRLPFVMSPCCTGKANVMRPTTTTTTTKHGLPPSSSDETVFYPKAGAPVDITYPRSQWLHHTLQTARGAANQDSASPQDFYVTLAKVADVGLGPQTPEEQRRHQRVAKYVVEMDRLMGVVEDHGYRVQIYRLKDHEGYGKTEIFVGVPKEHPAATSSNMEWI